MKKKEFIKQKTKGIHLQPTYSMENVKEILQTEYNTRQKLRSMQRNKEHQSWDKRK